MPPEVDKRWKIIIEDQENPGSPIVLWYQKIMWDQEQGLTSFYRYGESKKVAMESNGHQRIQINAWSGTEHWEDFVAREEKWE